MIDENILKSGTELYRLIDEVEESIINLNVEKAKYYRQIKTIKENLVKSHAHWIGKEALVDCDDFDGGAITAECYLVMCNDNFEPYPCFRFRGKKIESNSYEWK